MTNKYKSFNITICCSLYLSNYAFLEPVFTAINTNIIKIFKYMATLPISKYTITLSLILGRLQ